MTTQIEDPTEKKMKRATIVKLSLDELAGVDAGAQAEAGTVVLKRRDERPATMVSTAKRSAITSAILGHTHLVTGIDDMQSGCTTSERTSEAGVHSDSYSSYHSHPWIRTEDGSIVLGEAAGHTHEIAASAASLVAPTVAPTTPVDVAAEKARIDQQANIDAEMTATLDEVLKSHGLGTARATAAANAPAPWATTWLDAHPVTAIADVAIEKARTTFGVELLKFATAAKLPPARAVNDFVSTEKGAQLYVSTHDSAEVLKGRVVDAHKRAATIKEQLDDAAADYARQQQAFGKQLSYDQALVAVKETTKGARLSELLDAAYEATHPADLVKSEHQGAIEKEYLAAEAEFLKAKNKGEFCLTPAGKKLSEAIDDERDCSLVEQEIGPVAGLEMRKARAQARKPPETTAEKAKIGADLAFENAAKAHAFDKGCSLGDAYADLMETTKGVEMYRAAEKAKLMRLNS